MSPFIRHVRTDFTICCMVCGMLRYAPLCLSYDESNLAIDSRNLGSIKLSDFSFRLSIHNSFRMLRPPLLHLAPHRVIGQQHSSTGANESLASHRGCVFPSSQPLRYGGSRVRMPVYPYHGILEDLLRYGTQEILGNAVGVDVETQHAGI